MIEDKLTRDERIRLEALNQAQAGMGPPLRADQILEKALTFEKWIRTGNIPQDIRSADGPFS